jgi:hypothetical protein
MQAYVIYLFMSLLLAYLRGGDDDDYNVITYLETGPKLYLSYPLYILCPLELPRGKPFLTLAEVLSLADVCFT